MTYDDLINSAKMAGFTGVSANIIAAIAMAESGGNIRAININNDGSIDRGVLQFNNFAHPEISDNCAYDINCSFAQALRVSHNGSDFSQWQAYKNGAYRTWYQGTSKNGIPLSSYVTPDVQSTSWNPLDQITNFMNTLQNSGAWQWLTNPQRILKMVVGMSLIGLSIVLLLSPESRTNLKNKVEDMRPAIPKGTVK